MKKTLTALALATTQLFAHAWEPTKPITVIIGNSPGSGNEISFRMVADIVEREKKASLVITNRPGMGELIGSNLVASSNPDGYTVLIGGCQDVYVAPEIWYSNLAKFDPMEFVPVANIGRSPLGFFANPNSKVVTPQDLVSLIKNAEAGKPVNIAIAAPGHQLAVEFMMEKLNLPTKNIQYVLYKSAGQALLDVMGGHVEFAVVGLPAAVPNVQVGKLKVIGLTNEQALKGLEKYPLMKDTVPGLNIHACWNMLLPKGTPPEVQAWYHDTFVPVLRSQELQEKFEKNMMYTTYSEHTADGVKASMTKLRQTWQPIARKFTPQ